MFSRTPAACAASSSQRRLILVREIARALVDQLERAEQRAATTSQGYTQQRACLESELLIDAAVDLLLPRLAIHAPRLTRMDDLPDDPRVFRNPQLSAFHAQRRTADQGPRVAIPQEHAGALRVQQAGRRFRHLLEQLVHLECLTPLGGNPEHGLQTLDAMSLPRTVADRAPAGGQPHSQLADDRFQFQGTARAHAHRQDCRRG